MNINHLTHLLYTLLFGVAVLLFFGLAYPHHLHYQEQFQLFLFDGDYVWDVVKHPGGVGDLLGRFCTQFFLYAWVGAAIIAVLLAAVQLLMLRLAGWGWLYGLSFVPSFLLWIFLLDENALMSGVCAVLLTLLAWCGILRVAKGWLRYTLLIAAIPVLYILAGPVCFPLPVEGLWSGVHYHRYPTVFPWMLWAAASSVFVLTALQRLVTMRRQGNGLPRVGGTGRRGNRLPRVGGRRRLVYFKLFSFAVVATAMGYVIWKNSNFKAEKVMAYDFMARHQQWNRILETINAEKPNNQIGVTVQNLALGMHGLLVDHLFEYNQNGILGLLPDVGTDATSPLPTAEAFYQLGMITVAQRTVFEAQEAILDFQKSGRCYKRLAETNLILGSYEVARKYLTALQKTLFYRDWANETLPLLGDEEAIARHPEYGRLRQMTYKEDFYFGDHVTAEMLEKLFFSNTDNRLAYDYLRAYYILTGDRENYARLLLHTSGKQ